jgi:hypothetical protein
MVLSHDFTILPGRIIASVTTIMYHGSNIKNKAIILSQGLIPNPKKRKWSEDPSSSIHVPSRASLGGIYLTNNIMTALSSGTVSGRGGQCILVVVSVQTGNLLADEDDFKYRLNSISIPGLVMNEWMIQRLYAGSVALKEGRIPNERDSQWVREELQKTKEAYITNFINGVNKKLKKPLTEQEMSITEGLLDYGFFISLKRLASHAESGSWGSRGWGSEELWGVEKPDVGEAEAEFKRLEDRLTRVLKRVGRTEHRESDFNQSARIETPIGYSGKNRIVAVVEVIPYQREIGTRVKVLYPPSGEVPAKVIKDWEEREGPWRPVTGHVEVTSAGRW